MARRALRLQRASARCVSLQCQPPCCREGDREENGFSNPRSRRSIAESSAAQLCGCDPRRVLGLRPRSALGDSVRDPRAMGFARAPGGPMLVRTPRSWEGRLDFFACGGPPPPDPPRARASVVGACARSARMAVQVALLVSFSPPRRTPVLAHAAAASNPAARAPRAAGAGCGAGPRGAAGARPRDGEEAQSRAAAADAGCSQTGRRGLHCGGPARPRRRRGPSGVSAATRRQAAIGRSCRQASRRGIPEKSRQYA